MNKKVSLIVLAAAFSCAGSAMGQMPAGAGGEAVRAASLARLDGLSMRLSEASKGDAAGAAAVLDGTYSGSIVVHTDPAGGAQGTTITIVISSAVPAGNAAGGGAVSPAKPEPPAVIPAPPEAPAADKAKKDDDDKKPPFSQQLLAGGIGLLIAMVFVFALL